MIRALWNGWVKMYEDEPFAAICFAGGGSVAVCLLLSPFIILGIPRLWEAIFG